MVRITGIVIMTVHECHDKEIYLCKQIVHMDSFACLTQSAVDVAPEHWRADPKDQTVKINVY